MLTKIDGSGSMEPLVGLIAGAFGSTLAISWLVVIRSYRQLNRAKFGALEELEKELSFPFFTREWQLLRGYRRLSVVETVLPWMFLVLSGMLFLWAGYSLYAD